MRWRVRDDGAVSDEVAVQAAPALPPGRLVELPGRGTVFVRDSGGPPEQPVLLLFHGWLATADLNWGFSYRALTEHFRVVAFDQRGHGQGLKGRGRFDIGTCAQDGVAVLDALDIDQAIAVGYSMGGPIALSLAHHHDDRVRGIVLCATAAAFLPSPLVRLGARPLGSLAAASGALPDGRLRHSARQRIIRRRATGPWSEWISSELEPSDPALLFGAGAALARFDAWSWLGSLDAPTSVIITTEDNLVRPETQRALARGITGARTFEVAADHLVCFESPDLFAPVLVDACRDVATRRS